MDFPGYYDVILSYSELREMINNPDSNRKWHRMLISISGVYLILDKISGKQYIGSAYGKNGIWGRWKKYSKNPSGGNELVKKLLDKKPNAYENFQFSILRVLEHSSTKDEVIQQESCIKIKLGTRVFGLNEN